MIHPVQNALPSVSAVAGVMLVLAAGSASAGTMTASPSPPVVTSNDIANYAGIVDQDKWFGPGVRKGQTFTTGSAPLLLKSISYFMVSQGAEPTKTYSVVVGTFSGGRFTPVHSETFTQDFSWNRGEYMTWAFSNPPALAAGTTYGVEIEMSTSTSPWQSGIPYICVSENTYDGGQIYGYAIHERASEPESRAMNSRRDRIFHLDLQNPASTAPDPVVQVPPGCSYANGKVSGPHPGKLSTEGGREPQAGAASVPGADEPRAVFDPLVLTSWKRGESQRPGPSDPSLSPLFKEKDWTSAAGPDQLVVKPNMTVVFRTRFELDAARHEKMKGGRLYVSRIIDKGVVYVNGWKVGENNLYRETTEFRLNGLLRVGENVIAVVVTTGGRNGTMAKECRIAP
jgi:hypothetical protein